MPQKTYSLYNSEPIEGDQQLAVEIGKTYLALVLGTSAKLSGFEYYDAEENDLEELLGYIKSNSQLLDKGYSETRLYYNLEEAVLVPVGLFSTAVASDFIDLVHGNKPFTRINVENVEVQPGIVNVYRSNEDWQNIISQYFRAVTKRHLLSKLLESNARNGLKVQFYKDEIVVIARRDEEVQLAQSFQFSTDEDAVYHLLNTCKQTAIKPTETTIHISGFIDEKSPVFSYIEKYFGAVVIDTASSLSLPPGTNDQYPAHYFTPFFNLLQ